MKRKFGLLLSTTLLLSVTGNVQAADTAKQLEAINTQIQTQLQKMQDDQKKQEQEINTQIQAQLKQLQTEMQEKIKDNYTQSQEQIKVAKEKLESEIQNIKKTVDAAKKPSMPS